MINDIRVKNDKPSIHPDEACKFLLARNFDLNGSMELARNYEVLRVIVVTEFCAVTSYLL